MTLPKFLLPLGLATLALLPRGLPAQEPDATEPAAAVATTPDATEPASEPASEPATEPDQTVFLFRYMPLIGMGFTIVILLVIFGFVHRLDTNRHETIRRYLELGKEVPPQLISDSNNPATWGTNVDLAGADRRKGVICASVGLGLGLMLLLVFNSWRAFALGLIPLFIGLGYLALSFSDSRSSGKR